MAIKHCLRLAVLVVTFGCAPEEVFLPPARLAVPPEAVLVSFGVVEDSTGVHVLARPWVAALSESGRYLAIGEYAAPPLLRVLDRETGEAWSFGPRGRGPGELLSAHAVEFLGDSVLLVMSGQRLERFSVDGRWLAGYRPVEAGLTVVAIASGCGGRVYSYGAPVDARGLDSVPWIHELQLGPMVSSRPLFWTQGHAPRGWGDLHGFDASEEGILLWHKRVEPEVGYWIPCDGSDPTVWSHAAAPQDVVDAVPLAGDRAGMVLQLPDTVFRGAAVRGSTKVRARAWDYDRRGSAVTSLQVVDSGGCWEVELLGSWRLRDAHADGLVLSTESQGVPVVQLIDWNWFDGVLTPARCPPLPGGAGRQGSRGGR